MIRDCVWMVSCIDVLMCFMCLCCGMHSCDGPSDDLCFAELIRIVVKLYC